MKYLKIKNSELKTMVDNEDYEKQKIWNWKIHHGYVFRHNPRNPVDRTLYLHREIMGTPKGMCTDHKNGNRLDNRRKNLRICNYSQNNSNRGVNKNVNTSGYKGVSWHIRYKKWKANIRVNGRMIFIGSFDNPKEAYKAYCSASVKYHGEFSRFNK